MAICDIIYLYIVTIFDLYKPKEVHGALLIPKSIP